MTLIRHLSLSALMLSLTACTLNSPMPNRAPVSESNTRTSAISSEKPATVNTPATLTAGPNQYLVQKGDTLYSIARKQGISVQQLAETNKLSAPYAIQVGQLLTLKANANSGTTSTTTPAGEGDAEVVTSAILRPEVNAQTTAAQTTSAQTTTVPANTTVAASTPETATDLENINDQSLKWQWPMRGKLTAGFDSQTNKGLNIQGNPGQTIQSTAAGKVIYSGMDIRGTGKLLIVKHNNNYLSVYGHQGTNLLKEGTMVNSGDKVATLPANGTPNLHFEIRLKGKPVDPANLLGS